MLWQRRTAICLQNSESDKSDGRHILKIIGKETQKKIDLQLDSFQKKVAEQETQLISAKAEQKKLDALLIKAQNDAVQARADASEQLSAKNQEFTKKTTELSAQLEASKAEQQKLLAKTDKVQAEALKAEKEAQAAIAAAQDQLNVKTQQIKDATQENELLLSQLMELQEQLEKIFLDNKQLEATVSQTQSNANQQTDKLQQVNKQLDSVSTELGNTKADLVKVKQDLAQASQNVANEKKAKQIVESALAELKAKSPAELKAAKDKYEQQAKTTQALEAQLGKQKSELDQARQAAADAKAETSKVKQTKLELDALHARILSEFEQIKKESAQQAKAAKDKYEQQAKTTQALEAQLGKQKSELDQARQAAADAKAETSKVKQTKLELDALHARILSELEQIKKESAQQANQLATQIKDTAQENELLLTQLMQVQEEVESYYLDKTKFENLYQGLLDRWARLEKRFPNYVDFVSVELVAFDNLSDVPSVTWRVKDYVQGDVAFDEFLFQTVLQDGKPGIGLVTDAKFTATENSALVPLLLQPQSKQLERFVRMGQTEFRQLMAAATIVIQLEASNWRGVVLSKEFDLGFWRESLKLLPRQLQSLPVLLRYDAVKLKRELVNPDYEHLWLEFKGLGLGVRSWPNFEIRLGAAMVQRGGFSQFPKFEFPLIDGKTKPFESWYAESQDDNGAKLELRFSLDKQVFDSSVWAKLEDADKALLLRLIYAMPDALLRLEAEHASINRPWTTWVDFAKAAMLVIEKSRAASKQMKELPAPELQAKDKATESVVSPAKLSAPSKPSAPVKKASPAKSSAKTQTAAKKIAKPPVIAKKKVAIKKTAAVQKVAPVQKPVAARKALPVVKVTAAKAVRGKTSAATNAVAKEKLVRKN